MDKYLGMFILEVHKKKKRKIRTATNITRSFDMAGDLLPQDVHPKSSKLHANLMGTLSHPRKQGPATRKRGTSRPKPGV